MNTACSYGEERLASLLYEDGDEGEMIEMRAHLATCAGCRAELEELTSTKDLLSAWPNAVNVPRMVYVHESPGFLAGLRHWANDLVGAGMRAALKPAMAAAAVVLVVAASAALLDLRVTPDGRVRMGLAGDLPAADPASAVAGTPGDAVSREEFQEGIAQAVSYLEELYRSRNEDERRLLMAAIDERMQDQGLAMSQEIRGVIGSALADMDQQHQSDLGLVFSAIDELGIITGSELQRMNAILASLTQR